MAAELKILYANINHSQRASDHLLVVAAEKLIDIVAITEPYAPRGHMSAPGWQHFRCGRTGIWVRRGIQTLQLPMESPEATVLRIGNLTVAVAYFTPSQPVDGPLATLAQDLMGLDGPLLLLGDFNCHTGLVPGLETDRRGEHFEDFLLAIEADFWIPNAPTWLGPNGLTGYNDSVCYRQVVINSAAVLVDQPTYSDHRYIEVNIQADIPQSPDQRKLLKDVLRQRIITLTPRLPENLQSAAEVDEYVDYLTRELQSAIEASTVPVQRSRKPVQWWNEELQQLKILGRRLHRLQLGSRQQLERLLYQRLHVAVAKIYRKRMVRAKMDAWRKFVSPKGAWGKPYHVMKNFQQQKKMPALRKADGTFCASINENLQLLLAEKFPSTPQPSTVDIAPAGPMGPAPEITSADVAAVVKGLNNRKSPGPDNVNHTMLKLLHQAHPEILPQLFTSCLTLGYFPQAWKIGKVVFVPKPGKDPYLPAAYRPITLLSTIGKTLERILNKTILQCFEEEENLHRAQFGFRPGKSTEEAVHEAIDRIQLCREDHRLTVVLSCDIKGAFDNARWDRILTSSPLKKIPTYIWNLVRSYFTDRRIFAGEDSRHLVCGCPQGSVLGPAMWNAIHDGVIRQMSNQVNGIVCYADDTLLIVGARDRIDAESSSVAALRSLSDCLAENGLELNQTKTEVLVFNDTPRRLKNRDTRNQYGDPTINIAGEQLQPSESIKYLGVHLDPKLKFRKHIDEAVAKARRSLPTLLSICQNTFGYSWEARRVMIQGAVYSHLFYCSSVFYHRLSLKIHENHLRELQRQCDRMCVRAYRTISADGAAILNISPPLVHRLRARSIRWLISKKRPIRQPGIFADLLAVNETPTRADFKQVIDADWRLSWLESEAAPWTHQLFPTIDNRLKTALRPTFWLTQALSGHGVFNSYLHRFNLREDSECPCGHEEEDAEHVFRFCPRFVADRPPIWQRPLSSEVLAFMEDVVKQLWQIENPGQRIASDPLDDPE